MGFDGREERVGHLVFSVTEESISHATKLPREGERWHKHWFVLRASHNFALKPECHHVSGNKGYHHSWIKPEYLNPLIVIIHLVTCEGKFGVFKSCHLHLLAHFVDQKYLNLPFFFLQSFEKCLIWFKRTPSIPKIAYTTKHNKTYHPRSAQGTKPYMGYFHFQGP